jgi:hypothetical protein
MIARLARVLSLVYPACGQEGVAGLPAPSPIDFATLKRPRPPNSALAAPAGMHLLPDIITRGRDLPPVRLYAAFCRVALAQPGVLLHVAYDANLQAHFVARSVLCNFPDLVALQITPDSMPALYSRSVYGRFDFGVNRERLVRWLTALDAAIERS